MFSLIINDLVKVLHNDGYLNVVIDNTLSNNKLSDHERRLYTKIMYGVVTNKLLLDYYVSDILKGKRVKPYIKCAIRCGVYVIEYLDLKDYYAVNEIVDTVKKQDFNGSKFVNAVLRNYKASGKKSLDDLNKLDRLSLELSLPIELTKYLYSFYKDDLKTFFTISDVYNSYRINYNKVDEELLKKSLDSLNITYSIENNMLYSKESLINSDLFNNGYIISQDASSTIPALYINPQENEVILDACSAPGGKSLYMAELSHDKASIYSCDIYLDKLNKINDNAEKLGISCIKTVLADATNYDYNMSFDKILLDVPCSGLGTINHKPDLKYHLSLNDIKDIIMLQEKILNHAEKYLKVGGVLVYSTCTINKNENEIQINRFIKNHPNYHIDKEESIIPSNKCDGFYICKLIKDK